MQNPTIPEAAATVNFDQALLLATARAKAAYPTERVRIERGLAIALAGNVTLFEDGSTLVQSQSDPQARYHVGNGVCTCTDARSRRAPDGRCKHAWSRALVRWARKHGHEYPEPRYYASALLPSGDTLQGVATLTRYGWAFVPDDGAEPFYCAIQALALGGNVAIAEAKRQEEEQAGGLAHQVCNHHGASSR